MGDKAYKKLFRDGYYISGLREQDGRIYEYLNDVQEILAFDFNLQPGDCFKDGIDELAQMEVKQVIETEIYGYRL